MKNCKNIGIIGLGLIGGSLALKLAEQNSIIGIVEDEKKFPPNPFALISSNLAVLKDCDLIFICTPLREILNVLKNIQPHLKSGTIVSDVGSVKREICEEAKKIMRQDCYFIGGHPMAGTEKSGFENAFSELFIEKTWALMESDLPSEARVKFEEIIVSTGAEIIYTDARSHDEAAALISHLPILLSVGLLKTLEKLEDEKIKNLAEKLASSGFAGMTRLARGNPILNQDLLKSNLGNVKKYYEFFTKENLNLIQKFTEKI